MPLGRPGGYRSGKHEIGLHALGPGSTLEDRAMKKMSRLPHEEKNVEDGLPAEFLPTDSDVEGHLIHEAPDQLGTHLPGTGGDLRMPSGGGELTDDDVEGHAMSDAPDQLGTQLPGTGGDLRMPSGGGE